MAMRARRRAIAILAVLAVIAAVVACIVLLPVADKSLSEDVSSEEQTEETVATSADVTQDDAWILDFFRNIATVCIRGHYLVRWYEAESDESWDFSVTDVATEESVYFKVYAFGASIDDTGSYIWDRIDSLNERFEEDYDGVSFVETAEDTGDFTIVDAYGVEARYVFTDTLELAANDAFVVVDAIENGTATDADHYFLGLNEYGYTQSEMESVSITPEGEAIAKGELSVSFDASTSEERICEIVSEQECEFQYGDNEIVKFLYLDADGELADTEDEAVTISVALCTPEGENEWDVAAQFEEYDEVVSAHTQHTSFMYFDSAGTVVSAATEDQYYLAASGFEEAWETVTCDGAVTVGVIDAGIDCDNAELAPNIDTERMGYVDGNVVVAGNNDDMDDCVPQTSDDGATVYTAHGTWITGIISALAGDDAGIDGASYNAAILPVKYTDESGEGGLADVITAYTYLLELDEPPAVINISSGASFASIEAVQACSGAMTLQALINEAFSRGIVTVASAGNDAEAANAYNAPACLDNVVSVGALATPGTDVDGDGSAYELAAFSNTTSNVDICAYGQSIYTTDTGGGHTAQSGTSFSAPQVSAAAALLMAEHPSWDASLVVEALLDSAVSLDGQEGTGCGALDAAAAVTWDENAHDDSGDGTRDAYWTAPSSAVCPGDVLTTYAVRDGALYSEYLGVSNSNFDFRWGSTSAGNTGFDSIGNMDEMYLSTAAGAGLAIWATDVNENPNPYYTNLYYHIITCTYSTVEAASLTAATTWLSCPATGAWGDSDGTASYDADGNETIAGLEYAPDIVFAAGAYANWTLSSDGSNSDSTIYAYESSDDSYNPIYVNCDATNLWTQVFTLGQLATVADELTSDSDNETRYEDSSATSCAVDVERATRGQLLYIASLIDEGTLREKTVAYLYAIDEDGTGYFAVPTAEGLLTGNDTGEALVEDLSANYAANNAMISYGYRSALPFVTETFDSGEELQGGILSREQDAYKQTPACVVERGDAEALASVDVIIYNTSTSTSLIGTESGENISGIENAEALSESLVTTWAENLGFSGAVIAGDDFGDSTDQGYGSTYTTESGTAPLLVSQRDYTVDKAARAAWAFAMVYPEAYGNNDDATYCYWIDVAYHVCVEDVADVARYMTNQSAGIAYDEQTAAFVEACADAGYEWWVETGCQDSEWSAYAYYNGSSRASYYSGDVAVEEPTDTIGIFAPSSLWAEEMQ